MFHSNPMSSEDASFQFLLEFQGNLLGTDTSNDVNFSDLSDFRSIGAKHAEQET
jgi:hypothetical protein